ncbi:ATP-binding protein [Deinococcus kurensis]|uniref:ATP-binding protein n=1 Tax=Deinococcus kurensis TaxID=2662757 RepID=UPI0012D31531|nr:ATP-binding protein [Deinococcus kurensis]
MSDLKTYLNGAKADPSRFMDFVRDQGLVPQAPTTPADLPSAASLCGDPHCRDGKYDDGSAGLYGDLPDCPTCKAQARLARMELDFGRSALPSSMVQATWESVDTTHASWQKLQRLASRIHDVRARGYNAILAGLPGRGKSLGATLVLRSAIEAGYSARMLTAAQITQMALKTYRRDSTESLEDLLRRLSQPDFLAIDDLGAAETQSRSTEIAVFTQLIDQRVKDKKSTIITANLDASEDFEKALGFRAFERIRYKCAPIAFDGPNYRQAADQAEADELDRFIFGADQAAD